MDRFVSTFTNKIDAKGRVSVPASFRAVLERDGYAGGIYCYPSLDAPALDAGGQSLAQKIDGLLDGLPDYSDERDELSVALYGDVQSSASTRTDASCFLRRFARTPAYRPTSRLSAWARNSRCGSRRASKSAARGPAKRCRTIAELFGAGRRLVGGGRRGRSTGMMARRGTPSAEGVRRGTMRHVPVLLPEVLQALAPQGRRNLH